MNKKSRAEQKNDQSTGRRLFSSVWKTNLIVISALIFVVLGYFYWQTRIAEKKFLSYAKEHAYMLSSVVRLNAENAVLSQTIIEEVLITFLKSSAGFIDYLDSIQPFSSEELTAFAIESGLTGIRITRKEKAVYREDSQTGNSAFDENGSGSNSRSAGNIYTEGPQGWFPGNHDDDLKTPPSALNYIKEKDLYFLSIDRREGPGAVIVGLSDPRISELKEQIGLQKLFETISGLGGIHYVKMEHQVQNSHVNIRTGAAPVHNRVILGKRENSPYEVKLLDIEGTGGVAEVRFPLGENRVVTGIASEHFSFRIKQLWHEFFLFSTVIAMAGAFFTWVLHKRQAAWLNQVRQYEQKLAREKQDASLGRASASITHEVRNPLNAISMGLQRLHMEADSIEKEHRDLILTLLQAVKRTDRIIAELKKYSGTITMVNENIMLEEILDHIIALYNEQCRDHLIDIDFKSYFHEEIAGDRGLLAQVFENLMKNSIEAQPGGGYIKIRITRKKKNVRLLFENRGFTLPSHEAEKILDPYFTTKIRGTGLGLAMVNKIIHLHGGNISIKVPETGVVRVEIMLPLS